MDDYIRQEMRKRHIPGLQLAVVRDGKPVKFGYYGLANVEQNAKVKRDSIFQIQSMTKSFVSAAVLMLVEEGKIGLDDKIGKYLQSAPASWDQVTIRRLLSHTSGVKDFINEPTANLRIDVSEEEVLKATAPRPLNFPPGEKYAYSNTGYHLLGMVIRKLTGKSWAEFVDERICKPLGMNNTRVYDQFAIWPNRASGYFWKRDHWENGQYIAPTVLGYAGGGLNSTVEDLAKWDAALYTEKLLKRSTLEQAWTSAVLNNGKPAGYGFGWSVGENNGHRVVAHTGSHMTGFQSIMSRYVDDRLTVIILTNLNGANPPSLVQGVAHLFIPTIRAASGMEPKADPDPDRTKRLKSFIDDLAGGRKPTGVVPAYEATLDEDDRAQAAYLKKEMRSFEFLGDRDVRGLGDERSGVEVTTVCAYRLTTDHDPWFLRFWLAGDGKIADYSDKE